MQRAALKSAEPVSLQRGVAAAGYGSSLRLAGRHLEAGVVRDVAVGVDVAGCSCSRVENPGSCRGTKPSTTATQLAMPTLLDQLQGSVAAMRSTCGYIIIPALKAIWFMICADRPVQELVACVLVSDAPVVQLLHSLLHKNTAITQASHINPLETLFIRGCKGRCERG